MAMQKELQAMQTTGYFWFHKTNKRNWNGQLLVSYEKLSEQAQIWRSTQKTTIGNNKIDLFL